MQGTSTAPLYVAVLLYEASSDDPGYTPMFEECFVLLRAPDEEQARARAEQRGHADAASCTNAAGQAIRWSLKHVVDVNRVLSDVLDDGSDLYARHFKDYRAYRAFQLQGLVWPADLADRVARLTSELDAWEPSNPVPSGVLIAGRGCLHCVRP